MIDMIDIPKKKVKIKKKKKLYLNDRTKSS